MNDAFDIGPAPVPAADLDALHKAVDEAAAMEKHVEQLDADLSAAKKALHALKTGRIPDLVEQLGLLGSKIVRGGYEVTVHDFVSGSLPSDQEKREKAIKWLETNEAGGLIKTELKLAFGKGEHNVSLDLKAKLEALGFAPLLESGVHPQTLMAFARERIKDGKPIDTEALGLYTGKVAKFKPLDKPKKGKA